MTKPTSKPVKGGPQKGPQKSKDSKEPREKIVAQNRAASYNYHILEKMEAGLVLHGTEVKALREGKANIRDAYVDFKPSGPFLVNAHIAQYMPGGPWNHEPLGERKLLLHKREIHKFSGRIESKGLTVIPLRIYFRNGLAKVEIALAQGKKSWDRRQDERDKDARREADQALYRNRRR
ncbi:MAG TPA: SsrA-binding protein SmpB [Candidatus Acidoferrum sp.]|nr:SsrA-binding protein SmpB [Candidatus Acidoferrum sp.]HWY05685.1 SsrA-binding protein SmpB [Candidatus Acidoferrales bacterium]